MKLWIGLAALLAVTDARAAAVTTYENGLVWTGSGFAPRTLAVRDNRFVDPAAAGADTIRVNLAGGYVTPAFANAHAHVTNASKTASAFYTDAGVFYVWNPNTITMGDDARAFWARPDTYDVAVAQGGISEPGGHPEKLYVDVLGKYVYKGRPREWFVGNAFHYGRTPAEIDRSLDELVRQKADFVKAYLLHSERYAKILGDKSFYGGRGINPVHMPYLVSAAKKRGLKVAVHVETAHDLRVAALSGAHMAAHVPGYNGGNVEAGLRAKRLSAADAALVARSGILLVPTYGVILGDPYKADKPKPDATQKRGMALQADNIRVLRAAGATILIGTDGSGPITGEVEHLVAIGAMTAPQAVAAALGTGARLFPERRIGCFEAGCEADFLVLGADPTRDVRALRSISRRVMQGRGLAPAAPVAGARPAN